MRRYLRLKTLALAAGITLVSAAAWTEARADAREATLLADGRLRTLVAGYGGQTDGGADLRVCRTEHFRLFCNVETGRVAVLGARLESLYRRHLQASGAAGFVLRAPGGPLDWLCVAPGDESQAPARGVSGYSAAGPVAFYSAEADCVVLGLGGNGAASAAPSTWRVSHEMAHQLAYRTGLQTPGVLYPFWVSEGLAMNFETGSLTTNGFCADNPFRRGRLLAACRAGRLLPLDRLLGITEAPANEMQRDDLYAEAWGLFRCLFARDPVAFRCYLSGMAMRPPGDRPAAALRYEFVQAFGPVEALEASWRAFLNGLPAEGETPVSP